MLKHQEKQKRKQQQKEDEARLRAKVNALDDASSFSSVSTLVSLRSVLRKSIGGGSKAEETRRK